MRLETAIAAAERTGIPKSALYKMCRERLIRHIRTGGHPAGRLLIDGEDLDRHILEQLEQSTEPALDNEGLYMVIEPIEKPRQDHTKPLRRVMP